MSLMSFSALPFLLPLLVCALLVSVALYAHLNFKHIPIRTFSVAACVIVIPVAIFIMPLVIKMAFDFGYSLLGIQAAFAGFSFLCVVTFNILTPKSPPTLMQLAGLGLFLVSFYSLLA